MQYHSRFKCLLSSTLIALVTISCMKMCWRLVMSLLASCTWTIHFQFHTFLESFCLCNLRQQAMFVNTTIVSDAL